MYNIFIPATGQENRTPIHPAFAYEGMFCNGIRDNFQLYCNHDAGYKACRSENYRELTNDRTKKGGADLYMTPYVTADEKTLKTCVKKALNDAVCHKEGEELELVNEGCEFTP